MRTLITLALAIVAVGVTHRAAIGQQIPQYSHYMFNRFMLNPAEAGTQNFYQIRTTYRHQWVGVPEAPQTISLSAYGPHAERDMGFGGTFFNDMSGLNHRLGGSFSYAYNMPINEAMRVSGGLSLGFQMFRIDGTRATLGDWGLGQADPALFTNSRSVFTPDASIGFILYSTFYYVGISAHQLFGQRLRLNESHLDTLVTNPVNRLRQHIMLTGQYLFMLDRDWELEPSALIKFMYGAPLQVDLNVKVNYRKQFWGGLTFRWQDGMAILLGYEHQRRYLIGYSFEFPFTRLRRHTSGTHEIMIGYKFDRLK